MKSVITKLLELPIVICAFSFLFLCIAYLDLYKNTFNGSLDFIVPTKDPFIQKGPLLHLQKTYGAFLPSATSFHAPPSKLQSTEKSDSTLELWCENTDSYFERDARGRGREEGRFLRVIYFEPDD